MKTTFQDAKWVWLDGCEGENEYLDFFDTFSYDGRTEDAPVLNISADSQYALYLNGRFVACGQYADYPDYKVYDSVDLSNFVKTGENHLKVCGYFQGADSSTYRVGKAGVIYEVRCGGSTLLSSGSKTRACRSACYISGDDVPRITDQLSYSFAYDATKEDADYRTPGKADAWEKTLPLYERPVKKLDILEDKKGLILSQGYFQDRDKTRTPAARMQYAALSFCEFSAMTGTTPPVTLPTTDGVTLKAPGGDGIYVVVDLQQEDAGFLSLDLALPDDADIFIGYGEHLDDLRVRSYVGWRCYCAAYRGKKGRQQFIHPFKRAGLRYVQLHIYSPEATLYYAGIRPAHYPVSDEPYFRCGDHLHNKIYEVCRHTLLMCMHEHYEDCPWREQALYTMDSRNQMLCGYYCFGEYEFPKACIRLMSHSLRWDGLLELCSPARVSVTIPCFTAVFILQLYEYLLYSGDADFVKEMLPAARRIAEGFIKRINTENGLIPRYKGKQYWNFYEWQDGLDGSAYSTEETPDIFDLPLNAFVSIAFRSLSEICRMLDLPERQYYAKLHEAMNESINRSFWNAKAGMYASFLSRNGLSHYSELSNSLAVTCGAGADEKTGPVLEKLSAGTMIPVTLSHSIFKFEALMKKPEQYASFVFEKIAEIWGGMLFSGATSFWETQKGAWDFDNAGSLCHGWSAIPVYFYFAYGLGVRPDADGKKYVEPVKSGIPGLKGKIISSGGEKIII